MNRTPKLIEELKVKALEAQQVILKQLKYKSSYAKQFTWEGILNKAFPDLRISPETNLLLQLAGQRPDDSLSPYEWLAKFCRDNNIECKNYDPNGVIILTKRDALSIVDSIMSEIYDFQMHSEGYKEPTTIVIPQSLKRVLLDEFVRYMQFQDMDNIIFMNCRVLFALNMKEDEIFVG